MEHLNGNAVQLCCPDCDSKRINTRYENDEFEYGAGDKAIVLRTVIPVHRCADCGFAFTGEQAADKRHEAVCRHLGILTPVEILELRRGLELSRSAFAELTAIGVASLARWESGELLQSRSHDNLMRLASFAENSARLTRIKNGENIRAGGQQDNKQPGERFKALSAKRLDNLVASQGQFALRRVG